MRGAQKGRELGGEKERDIGNKLRDANILCYDKLVIRHLSRDLFPYLVIK